MLSILLTIYVMRHKKWKTVSEEKRKWFKSFAWKITLFEIFNVGALTYILLTNGSGQ